MLERDLARIEWADTLDAPVFFDRSAVEIVSFAKKRGVRVPAPFDTLDLASLYHGTVFFAPPWADIYVMDAERTHGFDAAMREEASLRQAYPALGYEIVDLPKAPVEERADFVSRVLGL